MSTAGSREINVTPLIDVLLVLLIIFLVMMPIMLRSEKLDLPPHTPDVVSTQVPLTIKLAGDLSVSIDDGPAFPNRELPARLRTQLRKVNAVFVDFVDSVPWAQVVATVDTVRGVAGDAEGIAIAARIHTE